MKHQISAEYVSLTTTPAATYAQCFRLLLKLETTWVAAEVLFVDASATADDDTIFDGDFLGPRSTLRHWTRQRQGGRRDAATTAAAVAAATITPLKEDGDTLGERATLRSE